MANISSAYGTFKFDKDFYHQHHLLIDDYLDNTELAAAYGIHIDSHDEQGEFNFNADGRWSMENTLPWCLTPVDFNGNRDTDSGDIQRFKRFFDLLKESGTCIRFNYYDYESGMCFLVKQAAVLVPSSPNKICFNFESGYLLSNDGDQAYIESVIDNWYDNQLVQFKQKHTRMEILQNVIHYLQTSQLPGTKVPGL